MSKITFCHSKYVDNIDQYKRFQEDEGYVIVDWLPGNHNTTLKFLGGERYSRCEVSSDISNLLSLAITSYIADEFTSREGTIDRWSRNISIVIPTDSSRRLPQVSEMLQESLSFVSGDSYDISFREVDNPLRHFVRNKILQEYDAVSLFSGGMDSLSGVIGLLQREKNLLLVGHYSDPLTHSIQQLLVDRLNEHFPGQIDFRSTAVRRVYNDCSGREFNLPDKVVLTHRVRSFLFLSLATVFCELTNTDNIYIPENGIIGLNVPLDRSRIGALSTRTAHPNFLTKMSDIVSRLTNRNINIINPFILKSKPEVVNSIPEEYRYLMDMTYSCAHGIRNKTERIIENGIIHCGYCLPCIYRRLSMMSIGMDDPNNYNVDVFDNLIEGTDHKIKDLRALASFVKRYVNSNNVKKKSMIMSNGHIPISRINEITGEDEEYSINDFVELFENHSRSTLSALREKCSRRVKNILGI